jgi:hypothetical protein
VRFPNKEILKISLLSLACFCRAYHVMSEKTEKVTKNKEKKEKERGKRREIFI